MPQFAIQKQKRYLQERGLAGSVMGLLSTFAGALGGSASASVSIVAANGTPGAAVKSRADEFEELSMPLARALYGTAFRMLGNSQRAEDMVQEAYVRAWEKFDQFQAGSNFKAWIFQILVFLCRNETRTHKNRPAQGESVETLLRSTVAPEKSQLVEAPKTQSRADWNYLYQDAVDDDFKRALDRLDTDNRAVLLLVSLAEFTYQECAEALDMPMGTVMSRLYRARKQLQDDLQMYAADRGFLRNNSEGGQE